MTQANLTAGDARVGASLPELHHDCKALTVVHGALAARDWRPQHHDHGFATGNNGVQDIFMNTPNLAAWFERYLTDWTGPYGRIGWIRFRMKDSVFPGDEMVFRGEVTKVESDDVGCSWAEVDLVLTSGGRTTTVCTARVAIPARDGDNPWKRKGDQWRPQPSTA